MPRFLDVLTLQPLADGRQFRVAQDFRYQGIATYTVPAGFVTDCASIPQEFWSILPPWGQYGPASILHDWLYWEQPSGTTRGFVDTILHDAMRLLAVPDSTIDLIYNAVTLFGQAAWDRNAELRASGYTKISLGDDSAMAPYASPITQPEGSTS